MKFLLMIMMSLSLWASIGNIMAIRGSANVYRNSNTVVAKNGMELLEADKIQTAKKSRVQVMLKDDTVVTIGANSSFSFEEFQFDGTKNSKVKMRATRGFFRSVTGKIGKLAPERFKVKTASATIGIRGTDFSGNIANGEELFKCYSGKIFIEFKGNVYDLSQGMMMEIFKNKYKIKKLDSNKVKKLNKRVNTKLNRVAKSLVDEPEIPMRVITDITRIVERDLKEPFKIAPNVADRPINY